jgi:hypothetical protein
MMMFGCVRVNDAETTRIRESSFASGGGGTQTMKGRGGAASVIVEGIGLKIVALASRVNLSTQMRRKIE